LEFRHSFTVQAPPERVRDFHSRSESMRRITPPPVFVQFHQAPESLGEGSEMAFTLWMGPLPVLWQARIEKVTATGFDDRQIRGPFGSWVHHHTFVPRTAQSTEVQDWVEAQLHPNPFLRLVGALMWLNMGMLFAFRAWRTRRLLEQPQPGGGKP
jgi:ligand-binding SRPBCC domain-containing protein